VFHPLDIAVVAINTMGGPTIPWSSGRVDAIDASAVTPDGRLPNADSGPPGADPSDGAHLRFIFNRMGFNDQEIVALSGAHALGRCHTYANRLFVDRDAFVSPFSSQLHFFHFFIMFYSVRQVVTTAHGLSSLQPGQTNTSPFFHP
jgi:catalase (peroxidase I)